MEKTVITIYLPEGANLTDLAKQLKEFDAYLESSKLPADYLTDSEELRGSLPKARKPRN